MYIKKNKYWIAGFALMMFLNVSICTNVYSQNDVITNVRMAIKTGSSKELSQYFGNVIVLNFDGEKSNYSKSQAEFVLKDFFRKYEPVDVEYIHQGDSKNGFKYIMGKYRAENGSFRIYILFKKSENAYYVDTMDFTRE
ncbi:MAG: DUF4783 domain-containing protein [Cyclobacteriaceae bacterium]|nr:DUF4783 domain-containing protein [Cyclobacteriaceae bacterium]